MKLRSLETIARDLCAISPADRQVVTALSYQLKALDWCEAKEATEAESALRRLLRDIVNKQGGDVRFAAIRIG